ncbi:MAG: hypothetical protein Kow0031_26720 [Anaerolineae bacterium]
MNWSTQTEEMTKAWADAQKKLWEQWYTLAQNGAPSPARMFDQWQKLAADSYETWAGSADTTVRNTAERVLASQKTMMQFWEFAAKAWQDITAKMEAGEDWQQTLQNYTDKMRDQFTQSADAAFKAGQDSGVMWQIYQEQMQKMLEPWQAWWQQAPGAFSQAMGGKNAVLPELGNLYNAVFEQVMLPFLQSPTMGLSRELEHKMRSGFIVWQEYRQADYNYQMQLIDAWIITFEKVQKELAALSEQGKSIETLEELGTLWVNAAEDGFGEVLASDAYIQAQGNMVNALMRVRIFQREMMEVVLKQMDLPTRSEVDAAHRYNYEVRKEVKSLKKQLVAAQGSSNDDVEAMQETVAALKKEVSNLKRQLTVAKNSAKTSKTASDKAIKALQKEMDALKKAVGQPAKPAAKTTAKAAPKAAEQGEG